MGRFYVLLVFEQMCGTLISLSYLCLYTEVLFLSKNITSEILYKTKIIK